MVLFAGMVLQLAGLAFLGAPLVLLLASLAPPGAQNSRKSQERGGQDQEHSGIGQKRSKKVHSFVVL